METVHFLSALNVFSGDFYEAEKGDYEAETHSEVEGSVAWLQWLKSCNMEVRWDLSKISIYKCLFYRSTLVQ